MDVEGVLGLSVVDVTPALISQPEAAQVMKVPRAFHCPPRGVTFA